jgi:hypothetical protein
MKEKSSREFSVAENYVFAIFAKETPCVKILKVV